MVDQATWGRTDWLLNETRGLRQIEHSIQLQISVFILCPSVPLVYHDCSRWFQFKSGNLGVSPMCSPFNLHHCPSFKGYSLDEPWKFHHVPSFHRFILLFPTVFLGVFHCFPRFVRILPSILSISSRVFPSFSISGPFLPAVPVVWPPTVYTPSTSSPWSWLWAKLLGLSWLPIWSDGWF